MVVELGVGSNDIVVNDVGVSVGISRGVVDVVG